MSLRAFRSKRAMDPFVGLGARPSHAPAGIDSRRESDETYLAEAVARTRAAVLDQACPRAAPLEGYLRVTRKEIASFRLTSPLV